MHASGIGPFGLVNLEEATNLPQNQVKRPGLVASGRSYGVAMHRIARPHHNPALALDCSHKAGEMLADSFAAETSNQCQAAGFIVRIKNIDQAHQIVGLKRMSTCEASLILDAPRVFDVCMIMLPRAIANPQHVAGRGVPIPSRRIDSRQRLFEAEEKCLVTRIEVCRSELRMAFKIETAGLHEAKRLRNALRKFDVAPGLRAVLYKA